ncbi:nucleoporin Nup43 isoform X2 [Protopterus annectens]|uniref:nucleoporin Nup43 isoform X2 n=1 Tax=Protopterus annectens TaxID=7888 RepID=UPI001CF95AC2|nr:nucleoporin Nup43 isoform X2 [Protopterus annectens]
MGEGSTIIENKISVWCFGDFAASGMEEVYEVEPQLLCEMKHNGDVLDLQFLDVERMVTASSTGSVTVYRHHQNNQTLSISQRWERAHYHSCDSAPCTGIVCNSPEIVTVGEDGRINFFRVDHKEVIRTLDNADSSTLHAVTFLRTTEILTVNSNGQLKIWDSRQQGNEPSQIFSVTGDRVPLYCVDKHPNQQHIVATGGQDGMLCIWDVRNRKMPVSLLNAHEAEMWEVHFHPSNPDHLFSCSEDGTLWHWDASVSTAEIPTFLHQGGRNTTLLSRTTFGQTSVNQSVSSAWLTMDTSKGRLEITNLLPSYTMSVNSLDVLEQCLVCGTDGEAIYVTKKMPV